jgi:hypothetical protein
MPRPQVRAPGILAVVSFLASASSAGCSDPIRWEVVFASAADRDATASVRAEVRRDGCSGAVSGETYLLVPGAGVPALPPLGDGWWGFHARAFDDGCVPVAEGCVEASIPGGSERIVTRLETSRIFWSECSPEECDEGVCSHWLGADADADADTDVDADLPNEVDVLFVVDNSNSMGEEQSVLAAEMEVLTRELLAPSGPGIPAVEDLHVGVVTTDMGTRGHEIQTCSDPIYGDDGVLQNTGRIAGCDERYDAADCTRDECPWLLHSEDRPDDGSVEGDPPIWEDFRCIATLGTDGCGFEQQLEASYAALVIQTGRGMPNEGFLREGSVLVVIYVTDEDDCSTDNADLFDPSRDDLGALNVRCALHPEELRPVSRYRDAFVDLRDGDADRVVVAAITGVPIDGSWSVGDPVEWLRYMVMTDPENPNELVPSCTTMMGVAFPPVRIVELVYSFGTNGVLASICEPDWSLAMLRIARRIQEKLPRP